MRVPFIAIVATLLLGLLVRSFAQDATLTKDEAIQTLQALKTLEDDLLKQLQQSDLELLNIKAEVAQVRQNLLEKNTKLNELEVHRIALERDLAPIQAIVRRRLKGRQLSIKRGEAFLRLLMRRGGSTDFLRSRGYLNAIAKLDFSLMQTYRERRSSLDTTQRELDRSRTTLKSMESKLTLRATEIDRLNEHRYELFEQAKREKRKAAEIAKKYGLKLQNLSDQDAESQSLKMTDLTWPVRGTRVRGYGRYQNSIHKTQHESKGWLIATEPDVKVHTIQSGRILYSGWFKGFGNLVVIQHTNRFHSVYAHLGVRMVKTNDTVGRNDLIGRTQQSSGNRRSRIYFEIRKDKRAVNPSRFVRKQRG